jgi:hypothetical protein
MTGQSGGPDSSTVPVAGKGGIHGAGGGGGDSGVCMARGQPSGFGKYNELLTLHSFVVDPHFSS